MASENEEILQNNNERENDQQQTIEGKSGKAALVGNINDAVTTNGDATDNKPQTKYTVGTAGGLGDYKNIRATTIGASHGEAHQQQQQPVRREENPFSFKHFLNWEPTTSSSTSNSSSFVINSTTSSRDSTAYNNETGGAGAISTSQSSATYQTSTGARPKVPQSSSSSLIGNSAGGSSGNGNSSTVLTTESSKMKRSPRFSSFDSQASLAEYAATGSGVLGGPGSSSSAGMNTRSSPSFRISQNHDDDVPSSSTAPREDLFAGDQQQFVPRRSYSNYDIEMQPSPRRKAPEAARPSRSFQKQPLNPHHYHHSPGSNPSAQRPPNTDFAAAAALPDFVQDHWMDSWHNNDLHSPPNSPNSSIDFVEDITGGAANIATAGNNPNNAPDTKCQTLPDFLSDGPIIHSSQRLADVAAGLPTCAVNWSNLDSPEDDSPSLQLSRLRLENERLCIELNETRQALAEQTRRANELDRSLEQTRTMESAYNRTMAQNIGLVEENLDQSKKRTAAAQNQVVKLNLQVKQLQAEVTSLRRENESLRDGDGAVGGSSSSERPTGAGNSRNRPSRSQQISRELLRAASTAESNLRQLLTGVDNLRQLAADIESTENRFDCDDTYNSPNYPPMADDFLDGCDDYEEYTGGPAL